LAFIYRAKLRLRRDLSLRLALGLRTFDFIWIIYIIKIMKLAPKLKIGFVGIFLLAFFFLLNLTGFSNNIRNFFYSISSPIQKTFWQTGKSVSNFLRGIFEGENLKKENESLKLKIQELVREKTVLEDLGKENEFLRQALGLGLEKDFKLELAEVIAKDVSQDILTINKGSEDGIAVGFPVITSQRVLIGRIGKVYQNFSSIILITDTKSSFDAKISGGDIYGVVKGGGNSRASLEFVPRDKEVKKDDFIVTSSLGGIFPSNLLVGQVKDFKKSDVEPFQTIELSPAFEMGDLNSVLIITKF